MKKTEPQHNQPQVQPAARQGGGATVESPQGEQTAQLEALIESSPQAEKLAQLGAMIDASPAMAAQRRLVDMIHNSPRQAAQAKLFESIHNSPRQMAQKKAFDAIHNSPRQVAQRKKFESLFGTAQRQEAEEPLQPKSEPAQLAESAPKPNNTGLPDNLKSGIENLSGLSMDNVKVHYNSSQPAQLNAHAYAQGTDIHVAPGQEKHLPHEAWHVVQQAQGRVKPMMQAKGLPINDDVGLEHEADVMGGRAMHAAPEQRATPDSLSKSARASQTVVQGVWEWAYFNRNAILLDSLGDGRYRSSDGNQYYKVNEYCGYAVVERVAQGIWEWAYFNRNAILLYSLGDGKYRSSEGNQYHKESEYEGYAVVTKDNEGGQTTTGGTSTDNTILAAPTPSPTASTSPVPISSSMAAHLPAHRRSPTVRSSLSTAPVPMISSAPSSASSSSASHATASRPRTSNKKRKAEEEPSDAGPSAEKKARTDDGNHTTPSRLDTREKVSVFRDRKGRARISKGSDKGRLMKHYAVIKNGACYHFPIKHVYEPKEIYLEQDTKPERKPDYYEPNKIKTVGPRSGQPEPFGGNTDLDPGEQKRDDVPLTTLRQETLEREYQEESHAPNKVTLTVEKSQRFRGQWGPSKVMGTLSIASIKEPLQKEYRAHSLGRVKERGKAEMAGTVVIDCNNLITELIKGNLTDDTLKNAIVKKLEDARNSFFGKNPTLAEGRNTDPILEKNADILSLLIDLIVVDLLEQRDKANAQVPASGSSATSSSLLSASPSTTSPSPEALQHEPERKRKT